MTATDLYRQAILDGGEGQYYMQKARDALNEPPPQPHESGNEAK